MNKLRIMGKYLFLTSISILSVFPVLWMIIASTNKSVDIVRGRVLPGKYLFINLKNLMATQNVIGAIINSFKYSCVLTITSVTICSLAGYGYEIYHDKKKDKLMFFILMTTMIPFVAIMIPLFQMFSKLHLLNSTLGFILPTIATPLLIMIFRQSTRLFPKEIIEAARIDGLSESEIFLYMFVPNMKWTYIVAMSVTFVNAWNNYLWAKVIMNDTESITMPMLVANLTAGYVTDYGILMLAAFLCTIPSAIVFFILQYSLEKGSIGRMKSY